MRNHHSHFQLLTLVILSTSFSSIMLLVYVTFFLFQSRSKTIFFLSSSSSNFQKLSDYLTLIFTFKPRQCFPLAKAFRQKLSFAYCVVTKCSCLINDFALKIPISHIYTHTERCSDSCWMRDLTKFHMKNTHTHKFPLDFCLFMAELT